MICERALTENNNNNARAREIQRYHEANVVSKRAQVQPLDSRRQRPKKVAPARPECQIVDTTQLVVCVCALECARASKVMLFRIHLSSSSSSFQVHAQVTHTHTSYIIKRLSSQDRCMCGGVRACSLRPHDGAQVLMSVVR